MLNEEIYWFGAKDQFTRIYGVVFLLLLLWWFLKLNLQGYRCGRCTHLPTQTKIALSPRALPKLHGLDHQHSHPTKGLLSLLLTHHFLVMDVDCCWPMHRSSPWSHGLLLWLLAYSNHHSTSVFVTQMDLHMHSQVHSFFSMLVHGNTFHSCGTLSVLRVPLLLF